MKGARFKALAVIVCLGLGCGGRLAATSEPALVEDAGSESSSPALPPRDASLTDVADVCVDAIGEEVTSHSCVHGTEGPYETVVLARDGAEAPDTSRLHVAYRLTVPAASGEGYVSHTPTRDGDHVLFTSRARVVRIEDDQGAILAAVHRQPVTGCTSFESAAVFSLKEGTRYRILLENEGATGLVFFEHMGSFGEPWARRCRDASRDR